MMASSFRPSARRTPKPLRVFGAPMRPMRPALLLAAVSVLASHALAAPPTPPAAASPDGRLVAELAEDADDLMARGAWGAATSVLREARQLQPDSPDLLYNLAICEYREGRFADAASLFKEAAIAGDAALAHRAIFNRGNACYREAERLRGESAAETASEPPPSGQGDPLSQAIAFAEQSLASFRDAIRSDPLDRDARANAELAHRLLRSLRDELAAREQAASQQQEDQQQQDQQQDGEQQQSGEQQQPGEQQQQPAGESPASSERGTSQQATPPQDSPTPPSSEPDASAEAIPQGELESAAGTPPENGDAAGPATATGRLSREQAERLLQLIRDREQQRRAAIAAQRQKRRVPVPKDW